MATQYRNQLVPNPVSQNVYIGIGCIFARFQATPPGVGFDLFPSATQQWPNQPNLALEGGRGDPAHRPQPVTARATAKTHKKMFNLVIRLVAECNEVGAILNRLPGK